MQIERITIFLSAFVIFQALFTFEQKSFEEKKKIVLEISSFLSNNYSDIS